jgi:hypothetical protein
VRAIQFVPEAWDAYLYWQQQDRKTLKRLNTLIVEAAREPFAGIGKPEPLRGNLSGYCHVVSTIPIGWSIVQPTPSWSSSPAVSTTTAGRSENQGTS